MPKTSKPEADELAGGLTSRREAAQRRQRERTAQQQREITLRHLLDSVCSGQWRDEIVAGRLGDYPPRGMRLSDYKVLTPPAKAKAWEQSNSGGKTGTRRWTPRGTYSGCRWKSLDPTRKDLPVLDYEDEHDALDVGETRHATRWWPPAICYSKMKVRKAADEGDFPPKGEKPVEHLIFRHDYATDETSNRVLRLVRLSETPVDRYVLAYRNRKPIGGLCEWAKSVPLEPVLESWPVPPAV